MAWSIFTDGGGDGAAKLWAAKLLALSGLPLTEPNIRFVYDWEKSEGGGGKYNPLNQGPVPGKPALTSTGSQYGGGAADFKSWNDGLEGAADYLKMPAYRGVRQALEQSNYEAATQALWQSPWASGHYGYGSAWSSASPPAKESALKGYSNTAAGKLVGAKTPSGNPVADALGSIGGVFSSILNPGGSFANFFKILAWIASPISWLRIFLGLAGLLLAIGGGVAIVGVV